MEHITSDHKDNAAIDGSVAPKNASNAWEETFLDQNGVRQKRYTIHDLGRRRGKRLGFVIADWYRMVKVTHDGWHWLVFPTYWTARDYLVHLKPEPVGLQAVGSTSAESTDQLKVNDKEEAPSAPAPNPAMRPVFDTIKRHDIQTDSV